MDNKIIILDSAVKQTLDGTANETEEINEDTFDLVQVNPEDEPDVDPYQMELVFIKSEDIIPNDGNIFDIETEIWPLAHSIKNFGLRQPLDVCPNDDGTYSLLGGERRWTAIRWGQEHGWNMYTGGIPCVVSSREQKQRETTLDEKIILFEENLNNRDMHKCYIEYLKTLYYLYLEKRKTEPEFGKAIFTRLSERVGIGVRQVHKVLKLADAEDWIQNAVNEKKMAIDTATRLRLVDDVNRKKLRCYFDTYGALPGKLVEMYQPKVIGSYDNYLNLREYLEEILKKYYTKNHLEFTPDVYEKFLPDGVEPKEEKVSVEPTPDPIVQSTEPELSDVQMSGECSEELSSVSEVLPKPNDVAGPLKSGIDLKHFETPAYEENTQEIREIYQEEIARNSGRNSILHAGDSESDEYAEVDMLFDDDFDQSLEQEPDYGMESIEEIDDTTYSSSVDEQKASVPKDMGYRYTPQGSTDEEKNSIMTNALHWFMEMSEKKSLTSDEEVVVNTIVTLLSRFYFPMLKENKRLAAEMEDTLKTIASDLQNIIL